MVNGLGTKKITGCSACRVLLHEAAARASLKVASARPCARGKRSQLTAAKKEAWSWFHCCPVITRFELSPLRTRQFTRQKCLIDARIPRVTSRRTPRHRTTTSRSKFLSLLLAPVVLLLPGFANISDFASSRSSTMPPKKETPMSEFERKRLENIANNNAILSGISTTADKIIPKPAPKPKPKPKAKRESTPRIKRETPVRETRSTRQSSRLAGHDADSEVLKRKLEVELEAEAAKAKAKKLRVSGDLKLGDIAVEGRKWENGVDGLAGLKSLSVRGAQPGVRTFTDDDVKETTNKGLKDLRLRMSGLKLYEKWAVNGRPSLYPFGN